MTPESTVSSDAAPSNFFSRLIGVYFSPGETFQDIGRAPNILAPLLVMMLVGGLMGFLMINRIGIQTFFSRQLDEAVAAGRRTQEQANAQLEQMTSGPVATFTKASFPIFGALQGVVMALIVAGIFKLISMVMGTENTFKSVLSVTLYTFLAIALITSVIFVIVLYLKSPDEIDPQNAIGTNLASMLTLLVGKDGLPKFIMALARWIDIFAIWMIALLSIGYAAISRKLKTSTVAIVLGGLYGAIALIAAVIATIRG